MNPGEGFAVGRVVSLTPGLSVNMSPRAPDRQVGHGANCGLVLEKEAHIT